MARPTKYGEPLAGSRSFRLPESDDAKFADKLARSGMETSEFVRDYVLKNRTEVVALPPKPSSQSKVDRLRLIGLVKKAGNNVNQIARRANSEYKSGVISSETYRSILAELEDITLYMKASLPNGNY